MLRSIGRTSGHFMMAWPRNASILSKLVSGVKGAALRHLSLGNCLPGGQVAVSSVKHSAQPCMSGLDDMQVVDVSSTL